MSTENTLGYKSSEATTAPGISEKFTDASSQLKNKASELGRSAAAKLDSSRGAAAGGLDSAADKLHGNADSLPGGQKVSGAAHKVANGLSSTATYIREHDVNSMVGDFYEVVKKNPGPALLGAAALGFLVARSFSKD